ncbi:uncharacterized protein LOC114936576 [Nylanderia fulva]|uniref:uncharacterized protein LOC114936576 n=1 Tax=Nylanderia fulva TaxID=613905 RepID=UPI0010FB1B64|nr:uncharacterized protein LOC114936576 [Nylanderia fulva]XP_029165652.1 uncharacterized protein LOC114936576 [Nylanderia fulva]
MGEAFNDSLEKLRKKSRTLLARVAENSKRIDAEVKILRSQTLSLINCCNHKNQGDCVRRNANLWKLRNNLSEINTVLHPDYIGVSPKRTIMSVPNMTSSGKLILTSKKPRDQCLKSAPRKPVKGCYCNYEVNKVHARSSRTQRKPASSCHHCRSQPELKSTMRESDDNKAALTSPINCETFRRVKRIDYTPRSQFLRNVQDKICELQTGDEGDRLRTCPRSSSYHRTRPKKQDISDEEPTLLNEHKYVDKRQSFPASPAAPANSLASERSESDDVTCTSSRGIQVSPRKLPKSTLRKTIKSKTQIPKSSERPTSKSPPRSKRVTQLRKQDCPCCCRSEPKRAAKFNEDEYARKYNLSEYCERRNQCLKHNDGFAIDDSMAQEVEDLRKFREQNYFETHGSSHTLASSRSSGSLQQYLLNERLFPESVGKIHKRDLVVTMPPCVTAQKKRIHYFPRYMVRQEKTTCNTNYRRKRCQSCPLTGHAIDLGVLKARPPLNSLALKYQKRVSD